MIRPLQTILFIGLGAAFASGCDRNTETASRDRSSDAVDAESSHHSPMFAPTVQANGPSRGCTANATCPNGAKLTCSVSGNGTCSGADGVGVQCITYDKDGNPEESGGACAGS